MSQTMRSYTVCNFKGGDGKTTIARSLAHMAAECALKTLIVDCDTQGNASQLLTGDLEINCRAGGSEALFFGEAELPMLNVFGDVWLLHGHSRLDALDGDTSILDINKLAAMRRRIYDLGFERVIFDVPPYICPRSIGPLLWSDVLLVPVQPTPLSQAGVAALHREALSKIRPLNRALTVRYIINAIHSRSSQHKKFVDGYRAKFGRDIIAELGQRIAVQEAEAECLPVWKRASKPIGDAWRKMSKCALEVK